MPDEAVDAILSMQPYALPTPRHNVLHLLNVLNNADKHVELTPVAVGLTNFQIFFRPDGGPRLFGTEPFSTRAESGAVVAIVDSTVLPPDAPPVVESKMKVDIVGSAQVAVKLPGYWGHFDIPRTLDEMLRVVREVLTILETFIPAR